jgi:hypothetical protein
MRVIRRPRGGSVIVMTLPVPAGADVESAAAVLNRELEALVNFGGVAAKNVILRSCAPPRSFAHFQQLEIGVERQFAKGSRNNRFTLEQSYSSRQAGSNVV